VKDNKTEITFSDQIKDTVKKTVAGEN
jgi:hypothetical protein